MPLGFAKIRLWLMFAAFTLLAAPAMAHLGAPAVRQIRFPDQRPEAVWIVVLNVGLLVPDGDHFRWLCDEAITTKPGFNDLAPLDEDGNIWVAATRHGLFRTTDGGCTFELLEGVLSQHQVAMISPHPDRPGEAVVYTETTTLDDDVHITTDAGETWSTAGLDLLWPIHNLVRSTADPERIYVVHADAAMRSDDGGRSFNEIAHVPPGDDGTPEDVRVLATDPGDANLVYASIDQLPQPRFISSNDGGVTWRDVSLLADIPETLIISPRNGDMLISMPFAGVHRSVDSGQTWTPIELMTAEQSVSCMFQDAAGRVWACALGDNEFVMRSEDFGDTWVSVFTRDFTQVTSSWACAEDSATALACSAACDRAVDDCNEGDAQQDAMVSPPTPDMAPETMPPSDGGVPVSRDASAIGDGSMLAPDASPSNTAGNEAGGCQTGLGAHPPWPLLLAGLFFGWLKRRN